MPIGSQSAIQGFLDRYRDARTKQKTRRAQELAGQLGRIRKDLEAAKRQRADYAHLYAPDFNIFNILRVPDQEFVHSNFLGELLDPCGTHGQGTLFLTRFLGVCEKARSAFSPHAADMDSWANEIWVRREASIFGGRFDLLIHAPGRLCLIIENKINASVGDTQLAHYRDWLKTRPEPGQSKLLVFLTPQMKDRSAGNIRDAEYLWLSYVNHIRQWLEECMERIKPQCVRSLVEQYLGLIAAWRKIEDAGTEP
jgi:hypothetical protein